MSPLIRFLIEPRRRRRLMPWTVAEPIAAWLTGTAILMAALAGHLDDERWNTLADILDDAAGELRKFVRAPDGRVPDRRGIP